MTKLSMLGVFALAFATLATASPVSACYTCIFSSCYSSNFGVTMCYKHDYFGCVMGGLCGGCEGEDCDEEEEPPVVIASLDGSALPFSPDGERLIDVSRPFAIAGATLERLCTGDVLTRRYDKTRMALIRDATRRLVL